MSKRRSSDRGAGEASGRASKLQCPGISGNNAKRAGPFILGKEATSVCTKPQKYGNSRQYVCVAEIASSVQLFVNLCNVCVCGQEIKKGMCV